MARHNRNKPQQPTNKGSQDRYSMDFGPDSRFIAQSEQDVEKSRQERENAKATFHNTKKMLTNYLGQATYLVKTNKAVTNFKKALLGLKLINKGTEASLELAEHKADLGKQAIDHRLAESKNHAVAAYETQLQQISTSFENRRNKQLGGSK